MPKFSHSAAMMIAMLGCLLGCRGQVSRDTPLHVNPNMDWQERYNPQEPNPMFADGRAARPQVPGTMARGDLKTDALFLTGLTDPKTTNSFVLTSPVPTTLELLRRGQERFNIYCAPCHDRAGTGKGIVVDKYRGFSPPPSYHEDRIRQMSDGEIFNTITHGIRTMPAYYGQVSEADRWAIIAYIRALQRSQSASLDDVPPQFRQGL